MSFPASVESKTVAERLGVPLPAKVAVLRARGLAGLLTAVPALRALRSALPESQITLIGTVGQEEFARRFGYYLDDFLELPGFPGLTPHSAANGDFISFLAQAQARRFDLTIQMHGCGTIANPLTSLLGARRTAGYHLQDQFKPDPDLYMIYPVTIPEVDRHLQLMEFLGIPSEGRTLEFPLYTEDWSEVHNVMEAKGLNMTRFSYICLELPSYEAAHQLPPDRWLGLAHGILRRHETLVLIGDPSAEETAHELTRSLGNEPVNLVGALEPGPLGALIADSRMLVCMQGSPATLALALGVPSLTLHVETGVRVSEERFEAQREIRWAGAMPVASILDEMKHMMETSP